MRNELSVLLNINNDGNTTQRDIAKSTGMSLGSVNILIKRLITKGLLKIEKATPRTIRYILTSKGLREKADATYTYIINSLKLINKISLNVDKLIKNHLNCGYKEIILFGEKDELYDQICHKLSISNIEYTFINKLDELKRYLKLSKECEVIIWNPSHIETLSIEKLEVINILDNL